MTGARGGRFAAALLAATAVVVHAACLLHHRVNVDEPQHLHVAWAWTQGLLPYRDLFDNHSPLFSFLMAPVVRAIGERPDAVLYARLAMLPFALATLLLAWAIGRRLYGGRAALWAVAIAGFAPDFMIGSVEYRTDQLWASLWMASLAVLLTGPMTRRRGLVFGLLVGAAFGVSMKTSLLLLSLLAAGAGAAILLPRRGVRTDPRRVVAWGLAALGGAAVVPGVIAAWFAVLGAWAPMVYNVFSHNVVTGLGQWGGSPYRPLLLVPAVALLWIAGRAIMDDAPDADAGVRRCVLLFTAGLYYAAVNGIWPLVTRQDMLPFVPMGAVLLAPYLLRLPARFGRWGGPRLATVARAAPVLLILLELVWTQKLQPLWRDDTRREREFLGEVLRLTRPGEMVLDTHGEAIFRPRPVYEVMEAVTVARIEQGLLRGEDVPARLIASRTAVAEDDLHEFPPSAVAFVDSNYLPLGRLRVLGQVLGPADSAGTRRFEIRVPQEYALACEQGAATGLLDGSPYRGPRELAAGLHEYRGSPAEGRVVVIWAPVLTRLRVAAPGL